MRSGVNCTRVKAHAERPGQCAHQQRLRRARDALDEEVPTREEDHEGIVDRALLADDARGDGGAELGEALGALFDGERHVNGR
jgi:hypothetical protein